VIFSFEEEEGEYADTDLETDSAGKHLWARLYLEESSAAAQSFNSVPHVQDGTIRSCTVSPVAPTEGEPVQGRHNRSRRLLGYRCVGLAIACTALR
jgi:hypothetical protein